MWEAIAPAAAANLASSMIIFKDLQLAWNWLGAVIATNSSLSLSVHMEIYFYPSSCALKA